MKKVILYLGTLLLFTAGAITYYYHQRQNNQTLTIGIYNGSSWDVPNNNQYKMIDYIIAKFKKKYPNVQIKYEGGIGKSDYRNWLSEKIIQGNSPDLMIVPENTFNLLASEGEFMNLSGYMNRDKISPNIFYPVTFKAGQFKGKQYALPYQANPRFIVMNKDLLLKNKISIPNFNWTPNRLKAICHQLIIHKKDNQISGITSDYKWDDALLAYNFHFYESKDNPIQLTSANALKGFNLIEYLQSMAHLKTTDKQMFDQGKTAFIPMSLAQYQTYTSYPYYVTNQRNFTWDCLEMPHIKGAKAIKIDISMFAIASKAKNPEMAWNLLKMLSTDHQIQQKMMQINAGCSVIPTVVRSKKTQKILDTDSQGNLTTNKLDKIMRNGWNEPKFKNFNTTYNQLDYSITKALDNDNLDKQLFYIQQRANEALTN